MAIASHAQEEIWVTTQDNLSLRAGPGQHWERLAVLPPASTMRAVGRTVNTDWIQVAYDQPLAAGTSTEATIDGITYGWLSADFLVWSGNVLLLPIDGIATATIARRSGPIMWISPGSLFYEVIGDFANPVRGLVTETTRVEVTGRIGSGANGFFWIQFYLNGRYYWKPTTTSGAPQDTSQVLDANYLFPFGRIYTALVSNNQSARSTLQIIRGRWLDLDAGAATTCNNLPARVTVDERLQITSDIRQAPIMQAPVALLQSAVQNINIAIDHFERVCAQPLLGRTAPSAVIAESLRVTELALNELQLLDALLNPIANRNPLAGN
jgi:hypothetical protein